MTKHHYHYVVEGELYASDLDGYANALSHAAYEGVEVSENVWEVVQRDGKPAFVELTPVVEFGAYNADDFATVEITCQGEVATFMLDGRA